MPTKAELERQVKSLKLQLATALAETRGTTEDGDSAVTDHTATLRDLQKHNDTLSAQLRELQEQLEVEKAARCEAEQATLEKQRRLVNLEREIATAVHQATEQLRQDLERRHKRELDAQLELIGMLKLQVHELSASKRDRSTGRINNDPLRPALVEASTSMKGLLRRNKRVTVR